jgi:hypothetical protein
VKEREDSWIVGLAAEAVGTVSARREVNIQSAWTREAAVHPLAVHFCSIQCKSDYMARLFGKDAAEEIVIENGSPAAVVVEEEIPAKVITKTTKVPRYKRAS